MHYSRISVDGELSPYKLVQEREQCVAFEVHAVAIHMAKWWLKFNYGTSYPYVSTLYLYLFCARDACLYSAPKKIHLILNKYKTMEWKCVQNELKLSNWNIQLNA